MTRKTAASRGGMDPIFAHAVIQPGAGARSAEGSVDARVAVAARLQLLGAVRERPLSRTWRARSEAGRQVALVVVSEKASAADRERFGRATQALHAAGHALTGVLRVHAVVPGREAYVADLLTTGTATDLSALQWPLRRRLEFVRRVVQALATLHAAGLVHGCLCADNVLLDDELEPALFESGTVSLRALAEEDAASYAEYAAPEVKRGEAADVRSDLFSAGRLLAEVTKGDDVPPALAEVVARCTAPLPIGRYVSASELAVALGAVIDKLGDGGRASALPAPGLGAGAAPARTPPRPPPPANRAAAPAAREREPPARAQPPLVARAVTPAAKGVPAPARWPGMLGILLLVGAIAGATLAGGVSPGLRVTFGMASPLGAALMTWVLPPLSRGTLAVRALLAVLAAALVLVVDPLPYGYRFAAQRAMHGEDDDARRAAVAEIMRLGRDFRGLSLVGANLAGAELTGADLRGVDLSLADLSGAHLSGAQVEGTSFDGAHLTGADLRETLLELARVGSATCDDATQLPRRWLCADGRVTPPAAR